MKTFVISDIHGCYDEFVELLNKVKVDFTKDRLVLLGDYIDRGPMSYEVLKKAMGLQAVYGKNQVVLLRGNHEQMALEYFRGGCDWKGNGAKETIKSFSKNNDNIEDYLSFFSNLPTSFQDESFIYVHAGLRPGKNLAAQKEQDLLWIREEFYESSRVFEKTVIFGHTPTIYINGLYKPIVKNDRISIDTACVYGGFLTALEIEDGKVQDIYQVKSKIGSSQQAI